MKNQSRNGRVFLWVSLLSFTAFLPTSFAAEDAESLLQKGKELFSQRNSDNTRMMDAVRIFREVISKSDDSDLQFDAAIFISRTYYWIGTHSSTKDARLSAFESGYQAATLAARYDSSYAEAPYYYAINLARWAKTKGILESLDRKEELIAKLNETLSKDTREFENGRTLDSYGPDRVFGKMYHALPFFSGGDHELAIEHIRRAYESTPAELQIPANVLYYAEILQDGDSSEEELACRLLKENKDKSPEDFNAEKIPESRDELLEIRQRYQENCE